jgi:hypothetical protein
VQFASMNSEAHADEICLLAAEEILRTIVE